MKILFITANRIGDAILGLGLLRHLVEQYPQARFTIACGPVAADLYGTVPRLERLITLKKQKYNKHWVELWKACKDMRWDMIVDLRNSLVTRLLSANQKFYGPIEIKGAHKVVENAATLKLSPPPSPTIWLDDKARARADKFVPENTSLLALGPAANWPAKQWPVHHFVRLAKKLTAADGLLPDAKILVIAGANEREQIAPLLEALPNQVVAVIGEDLLTAAACMKKARLFVGNDSGLMHMAAAIGIPTLGLFGPGYEKTYGPWGTHTAYVRTPESTAELLAHLPQPGAFYPNLMGGLTVDVVVDAAKGLMASAI